jgi:cytochrome P450
MKHRITEDPDPFRDARKEAGVLPCEFQGDTIPMILRHADVREAAKDWKKFSSDAPFRVPIPSEEEVRSMRQLPVEIDPPEHTEFRAIVEPFFARAKMPEVIAGVERIIQTLLTSASGRESVEVVNEFALPLQSRALALLLNLPESEAETWIRWGTHVFRVADGGLGKEKGAALDAYLRRQFERASANPGDDMFSALARARFRGRPLTHDEMMGFANLTFAGGRDTIINSISGVIGYLARNPDAMEFLRQDPRRIVNASEEFFRAITPLTHIGRVCPVDTEVRGVPVKAGHRVSLCWASANHDETVFEAPDEVRLDRKPNPHVAFGFGTHLCLGAPHARLILRSLLKILSERVEKITLLDAVEHLEKEARYRRAVAYDSLRASFTPR